MFHPLAYSHSDHEGEMRQTGIEGSESGGID